MGRGDRRRIYSTKWLTMGGEPLYSTIWLNYGAISLAAASKHIKALENAGLIRREVRGRTHLCRLEPQPLASAHQWLGFYERYWSDSLDVLERLLRNDDARKAPNPKKGDDQ